jgi:hypothetical protein
MNDRPNSAELLAAARGFLETELIPSLADARLKFQTLIVANVLSIVEREIGLEEKHLDAEQADCTAALGTEKAWPTGLHERRLAIADANRELCDRIRAGEYDEPAAFRRLSELLQQSVTRKLEVANPKYLANFGK